MKNLPSLTSPEIEKKRQMANNRVAALTVSLLLHFCGTMSSYAAEVPVAPPPAISPTVHRVSGLIDRDIVWSGDVTIDGKLQVLSGVVVRIEPGTRIMFGLAANRPDVAEDRIYLQQGARLLARGTESRPIVFSSATPGLKWFGLELHSGDDQSSFAYCRIQDSRMGIACVGSSPSIEESVFTGNEMGVSMWKQAKPVIRDCKFLRNEVAVMASQQSAPTVTDCTFEESGKTGVSVEIDCGGVVEKSQFRRNKTGVSKRGPGDFTAALNSFDANEIGVYVNQEGAAAVVRENSFTNNRQGVSVATKASPRLTRNTFDRNDTAVSFDARSTGEVSGNDFTANRLGLRLSRTSSPGIVRNLFSKNDTAVLCEYSSYPTIAENNFLGNTTDIRAGDNQSFEWTRNVWPPAEWDKLAATYGRDRIVARDNYWGEETTRKMQAGTRPIEALFDYHQSREILVKEKAYRRDEIDYRPFSPTPIGEAGPAGAPGPAPGP
jgi:hypothetical protein